MRKTVLILLFCIALFCQLLFVRTGAAYVSNIGRLAYEKNSLYHRIMVYQLGSVMTLRFGRQPAEQMQSQVDVKNLREHMLEYSTLTFCGLLYNPEPKKVLVVGLGGGVIPREMHHYFPEAEIDVVEIDPDIRTIAKQFFSFHEDDNLRVHIDDGRMFIKKQLRADRAPKYDIVILDAFINDYIPFHLMTKEFLEELKGVIADDGAVVANVFYNNHLFDAELKTFLAVFGRCQVFWGEESTNAMLVSPGPAGVMLTRKEAVDRAKAVRRERRLAFNLPKVATKLRPDTLPDQQAQVLTDDRAPVNRLRNKSKPED